MTRMTRMTRMAKNDQNGHCAHGPPANGQEYRLCARAVPPDERNPSDRQGILLPRVRITQESGFFRGSPSLRRLSWCITRVYPIFIRSCSSAPAATRSFSSRKRDNSGLPFLAGSPYPGLGEPLSPGHLRSRHSGDSGCSTGPWCSRVYPGCSRRVY